VRVLGTPAAVATLATALGLLAHPLLRADAWLPGASVVVPALALLLIASLALRSMPVAALGAAAFVFALGYDTVRGNAGTLTLAPGQGTRTFEEEGPEGRRLGFRPLGFELILESLEPGGAVTLATTSGRSRVTPDRAAALGRFRFGGPRTVATGEASVLRLSVTNAGRARQIDLVPGETAAVGDLTIALERYFPDFALDERNQPFSRSNEARNPAALLQVRRSDQAWRVFVIRAVPGIHEQDGLAASFALVGVEPSLAVTMTVTRQPAAPLVAAGLLVLAVGLAVAIASGPFPALIAAAGALAVLGGAAGTAVPAVLSVAVAAAVVGAAAVWKATTGRLARGTDAAAVAAAGGGALALALAGVGGRSLLSWSFILGSGDARLAAPQAGLLLALAFLAALAGTLILCAHLAAGTAPALARLAGQRLLLLAVGFALLGLGFAVYHGLARPAALAAGARGLMVCAGALCVLVLALMALLGRARAGDPGGRSTSGSHATRIALVLAVLAVLAAAAEGYWRRGTYATPMLTTTTAAALMGLGANESTRLELLRLVVFLLALLSVLA